MKKKSKKITLTRALLAGLFCGLLTSVAVVLYTLIYRDSTNLEKFIIISPVPIFIGIPLLMIVSGIIYFLLVSYVARGETWFVILFIALMLAALIADMSPAGKTLVTTPHGLLFGISAITGLAACIFLPYLAHHPRIYMTAGEMKWE